MTDIVAGTTFRSAPVGMMIVHSPDERRDPTVETWVFANEMEDDEDGCGWLEVSVTEVIDTKTAGKLAVYYRRWFNPEGEPMARPYRRVASISSLKALIGRRKMTEQRA